MVFKKLSLFAEFKQTLFPDVNVNKILIQQAFIHQFLVTSRGKRGKRDELKEGCCGSGTKGGGGVFKIALELQVYMIRR